MQRMAVRNYTIQVEYDCANLTRLEPRGSRAPALTFRRHTRPRNRTLNPCPFPRNQLHCRILKRNIFQILTVIGKDHLRSALGESKRHLSKFLQATAHLLLPLSLAIQQEKSS